MTRVYFNILPDTSGMCRRICAEEYVQKKIFPLTWKKKSVKIISTLNDEQLQNKLPLTLTGKNTWGCSKTSREVYFVRKIHQLPVVSILSLKK